MRGPLAAVLVMPACADRHQGPDADVEGGRDGDGGAGCARAGDGRCVGVTLGRLCEEEYCVPADAGCGRVLRVREGAGGDGSEQAPFASLAEAARVARDGDCVAVAPGRYRPAVFTASVQVLGAGADAVTIEGDGDATALAFADADDAVVTGVRLLRAQLVLQTARSSRVEQTEVAEGHEGVGVLVSGEGTAELLHVRLAGPGGRSASDNSTLQGIHAGDGAEATLRRALVEDWALGVVASGARLEVEATVIRRNGAPLASVAVQYGAELEVGEDSLVQQGYRGFVVDDARLRIAGSAVEDFAGPGVHGQNGARVEIQDATVCRTGFSAVTLLGQSSAVVARSRLGAVRRDMIVSEGDTIVAADTLQVLSGSGAEVADTRFRASERADVIADGGESSVTIRGSTFEGSPHGIVWQRGAREPVVQDSRGAKVEDRRKDPLPVFD